MGTRHSLAAISLEMERQKRDAQSRQEQDRVGRHPGLYPRGKQLAWRGPSVGKPGLALGMLPGCGEGSALPSGPS